MSGDRRVFPYFLEGLYGPVSAINSNRPQDRTYPYLSEEKTHILYLISDQNAENHSINGRTLHIPYREPLLGLQSFRASTEAEVPFIFYVTRLDIGRSILKKCLVHLLLSFQNRKHVLPV